MELYTAKDIDNYFLIFLTAVLVVAIGMFFMGYFLGRAVSRNVQDKTIPPVGGKCTCDDVNTCEIWCYAKQRFAQDHY